MPRFTFKAKYGHAQRAENDVKRYTHLLDLTRANFGHGLMDDATEGILWNMLQEKDDQGTPWEPLSAKYDTFKYTVHPGQPMSVFDGHMRTHTQLAGTRTFTATVGRQTYGIDAIAQDHAELFSEGGLISGTAQPARRFYGFTREAIDDMNNRTNDLFANFQVTT